MKIVAIDASPEKEWGAISLLLDPYLEGLREAGADVELFYSRDLLIFPCCGNLNCTVRTPGQCMACDDMRWLRPKIGQADVLVLASPLYFNGLTGEEGVTESMARLIDRLALARDFCDDPYEHAVHTTRENISLRRVVIVSGCGFWEIDDLYPVLTHLKAFCYNSFPELAGCITGGHRVTVRGVPGHASSAELTMVARAAGRKLVEEWQVPAARVAMAAACDGGAGPAVKRQWEAITLFEFSMMR